MNFSLNFIIGTKFQKIKKDSTGQRNRSTGIFNRDEWVYKKCKELYFDHDVQRLNQAKQ